MYPLLRYAAGDGARVGQCRGPRVFKFRNRSVAQRERLVSNTSCGCARLRRPGFSRMPRAPQSHRTMCQRALTLRIHTTSHTLSLASGMSRHVSPIVCVCAWHVVLCANV